MIKRFRRSPERTDEPEKIGPYRISGVLGRGGMGVVYSAEDERLGRKVALKTLGELKSKELRDRLWREARAAASLNHPGICQVYGVEEREDELWVAMEFLEGEGLDARLEARARWESTRRSRSALEVLDPLGFLHGRGLVHRDLKPSNIFLTELGTRLLDFGLARPVDEPEDMQLTQTGDDRRHPPLHGARAVAHGGRGTAERPLLVRGDPVRDAVGQVRLPGI